MAWKRFKIQFFEMCLLSITSYGVVKVAFSAATITNFDNSYPESPLIEKERFARGSNSCHRVLGYNPP